MDERVIKKLTSKQLANTVDEYVQANAERIAADKKAKELKEKETKLKDTLIEQFILQDITGIGGKLARVSMPEPTKIPVVHDWDKYYKYILETEDFSLLERRPGKAAIKERWDAEEEIPGVSAYPVYKLSVSKVK